MKIIGKIDKVMQVREGTSKAGKDWKKVEFTLTTDEEYNNLYCFEIFGSDKVDNFLRYNKVDDVVEVDFNVKCRQWEERYFTTLEAWKVFKAKDKEQTEIKLEEPVSDVETDNDLPF